MGEVLVPLLMALTACAGLRKKQNIYGLLTDGAEQGLKLLPRIATSLIVLLSAIHMLRASGAMELLTGWLTPLFRLFGIPPEAAPLVLIRPFSGSAALAIGADLMAVHGPDSPIGRTVAVMLGSTETTFYTISVYFGAAGIRRTRYAVPAALAADAVGFFAAAHVSKWL